MLCLNCRINRCPPGYITCSQECNIAYRNKPVVSEDQIAPNWLTVKEICSVLNLNEGTFRVWQNKGIIPFHMVGGRYFFVLEEVKEALTKSGRKFQEGSMEKSASQESVSDNERVSTPVQIMTPMPSVESRVVIRESDVACFFGSMGIRDRMLLAAKEAARDVVLKAADEAKRKGDHKLRADLLDDFVHLEEGLKMIFQERKC